MTRGALRRQTSVHTARWADIYVDLSGQDASRLSAEDLDALAEAAWWLCHVEESIAARHNAYAAFLKAGDKGRAARSAWRLFHDHFYLGANAVAVGWLRRGLRDVEGEPGCIEHGWLVFAEAELDLHRGSFDEAETSAARAVEIARKHGDADLAAMGLQMEGRALVGLGRVEEGLALLDEAMTSVLAGELAPMFIGWVYCSVILACRDLADLQRASEWTEAARSWCDSLPANTPYQGLCRVYRGEVLAMLGAWQEAEAEMRHAHEELLAFKPGAAAEASYWVGEILRRRGDLTGAEQAFLRAHELGGDPQPGLALVRLAQGRLDAAGAALRLALESSGDDPFRRARLLAAQVEVELATGRLGHVRDAVEQLRAMADRLSSRVVQSTAAAARGSLRLAEGDTAAAMEDLRTAINGWRALSLPYEEAQTRLLVGTATGALGDEEGGRLEIDAARAIFDRLGTRVEVSRVDIPSRDGPTTPTMLTEREIEVLRLAAGGKSNRAIASVLHISEHTVARHLQNIFAKLDVSSRTAATSFALKRGLL